MKNKRMFLSNPFLKTVSFVLSLIMLFYVMPLTVFASLGSENASNAEPSASDITSLDTENLYAFPELKNEAFEVVELRTESSKTFRLTDGTYTVAQYRYQVHELDSNGEWQEIESALSESGADFVTNDARVKFSKKIPGNEGIFTLHEGNGKIHLSLDGAIKKTEGKVYNGSDEDGTELQKMLTLNELTSRIVYADILNGVDIEYVLLGKSIKENIIVKEKSAGNSFSFTLSLNNLTATLKDGNVIISRPDGTVAYTVPAPIVFDDAGVYAPSDKAAYALSTSGNGKYTLTVSVSEDWMNSSERAYPVTIDPTISTPNSNISDTYVYPSTYAPNSGHGNDSELTVSYTSVAYVKVNTLPNVPKNAYITEAKMYLTQTYPMDFWDMYVGAYEVTSGWDESLTYSQYLSGAGAYSSTPTDFATVTTMGEQTYSWDITEIARGWYSGSPNYGVAFKAIEDAWFEIYIPSSESSYSYARPHFTVSYTDMKGVEGYYSYSSQSAGIAGVGSVNLASGKLSFAISLLSTTDSLMPTSLSAVYNSDLANKYVSTQSSDYAYTESFMPKGFKLNISETLLKKSYVDTEGQTVIYYVLSDADGTEHAFIPVKTQYGYSIDEFVDEDGLQLTLNVIEPEIKITDNARTVKLFEPANGSPDDECFYLSEIQDVHGNKIDFSFGSNNRPIKVSLVPKNSTKIDFLTLSYNSNGILSSVSNDSSGKAVYFNCDGNGNLTSVRFSYAQGAEATAYYVYDTEGKLVSVTDGLTGYAIEYTYSVDKVTAVTEKAGNTVGQTVGISYHSGYSVLRTSGSDDEFGNTDDILTSYVFDRLGRAVSVYSTDTDGRELLGATYGEYEEQENVRNNLKKSAVSGGSETNYLINGDFSDYSTSGYLPWTKSANVIASNNTYSTGGYYTVRIQPSTTDRISQTLTLEPGSYTLCAVVTPNYSVNVTAYLKVTRVSDGSVISEEIPMTETYLNDTDVSLGFEVNVAGEYTVSIEATGGASISNNPTLSIYGVALTKNVGASKPSLVDAGHAETVNASYPANSFWKDKNGNSATLVTDSFGKAIKVTGSVSSENYVKQIIYTAPSEITDSFGYSDFTTNGEKTYMLAAMIKAPDAVANSASKARVRVEVRYYQGVGNGDFVEHFDFDVTLSNDGWQFISGDFNTYGYALDTMVCVKEISVICEYSYQPAGYALFDEISIVECTGASISEYAYYENGLLQAVRDAYYTTYYEYDELKRVKYEYVYSAISFGLEGEYTEYVYSGDLLRTEIYGSFKEMPGYTDYVPKTAHEYMYNVYGQCTYDLYGEATYDSGSGDVVVSQYYSPTVLKSTSYKTTAGSKIFGATLTTNDNTGRSYRYYYNENNGQLLAEINVTDGIGTAYSYDAYGNLVAVKPATYVSATAFATVENAEGVDYTYNQKLQLNEINTDSTDYTLAYDAFGNTSSISAGNNTLASYEYSSYNGKLNKLNYGNGHTVEYVYDTLENISEVWYNDIKAYEYTYTKDGSIAEVKDLRNGRSVRYKYDTAGRVIGLIDSDSDSDVNEMYIRTSYNQKNEIQSLTVTLDEKQNASNKTSKTSYLYYYLSDGRLDYVQFQGTANSLGRVRYSYDELKRTSGKNITYGQYSNTTSYEYTSTAEHYGHTNELVTGYTSTVGSSTKAYSYEYDARSNITSVSINGTEKFRYVYDDLNQLIREDNVDKNATFVYNYDTSGNITSVKKYSLTAEGVTPSGSYTLTSYGYSSDGWGDKLTSFNGQAITYDSIGNPLTYYNGSSYSFTWQGRQLVGATKGNKTMSFEYNADGIRTSKTVNGVTTKYYLNGSQIVAEVNPNYSIMYIYDAEGSPIGMQYRASSYAENVFDYYFFEKNLQGDIVAVYGSNGTKYVEYSYDAWGNFQIGYHNAGNLTPAVLNPFTYRGYYYDSDLGLYYLNSRYYDQNTRRFINEDSALYHSMFGYNMFAYCENNPVSYIDPTGKIAITASIGYGLVYLFVALCGVAYDATHEQHISKSFNNFIDSVDDLVDDIANLLEDDPEESSSPAPKVDDPPQSVPEAGDEKEVDDEKDGDRNLPTTSEPNTDKYLRDKKGIKQKRHYGPDGKAEYDIDYRHQGDKHKFPHKHEWNWNNNMNPRSDAIDIF